MSQYTGRAWREGAWWVIDVHGVGATQARPLDKIDHMARSLVVDVTGVGYETVTISAEVDLPREVAAILKVTPGRVSQIARKAGARRADVAKSARPRAIEAPRCRPDVGGPCNVERRSSRSSFPWAWSGHSQ